MAKKAIVLVTVLWLKDGIGISYDHRAATTSEMPEEKAKELEELGYVKQVEAPKLSAAQIKAAEDAAKKAAEDEAAKKAAEEEAAKKQAEAGASTGNE